MKKYEEYQIKKAREELDEKHDILDGPKKQDPNEIPKPEPLDSKYKIMNSWNINPKSITMGELFGEENEEKKIFEYGICTNLMKKALDDDTE